MRYFVQFSYNGSAYSGWQIQPNSITVQEVFTKVLQTLLRENIELVGAGRTDAGVHAKKMIAHFDSSQSDLSSEEYLRKMNSILPKDIAVQKIYPVQPDAHARFDALARSYEYRIHFQKDVFKELLSVRMYHTLDFELMNMAAQQLLNYTDFTSFSKLHTDAKTNNCALTKALWKQEHDEWVFEIQADRFLRNMVRAIVGTLLEVGRHKISVQEFCDIIEAKDRCKAGASVSPHGLYLVDIVYPEKIQLP